MTRSGEQSREVVRLHGGPDAGNPEDTAESGPRFRLVETEMERGQDGWLGSNIEAFPKVVPATVFPARITA